MANLGDTYLASLNDPILYCTVNAKNMMQFHKSIEEAEAYKIEHNLDCIVWENNTPNPNKPHKENYKKLNVPFRNLNDCSGSERKSMQRDNYLSRYSKNGY